MQTHLLPTCLCFPGRGWRILASRWHNPLKGQGITEQTLKQTKNQSCRNLMKAPPWNYPLWKPSLFTDNTEWATFTTQPRHLNLWGNPALQDQAEHCMCHLLGQEEGLGCASSYQMQWLMHQGEQLPFGGEEQKGTLGTVSDLSRCWNR